MGRALLTPGATGSHALRAVTGGDPDDERLVERVRAGEDRAFETLFERHHRWVAGYVRGLLRDDARAEDVTQEVFLSALRRMRETDRPIAFRAWIHEIARNACIDEFRRARRRPEVSMDTAGEDVHAAAEGRLSERSVSPADAVDQRQRMHDLVGAFDGLSETHHRILVLRELGGLSYREIGEELGMSVSAVESTLFRARRRLGDEYRDLTSGEACVQAQARMEPAARGRLRGRELRELARHVEHCPFCRMKARVAGVDAARLPRAGRRRSIAERVGALLPLPAVLRDRLTNGTEAAASGAASHGQGLMAHLPALAPVSEPLAAGWGKAAAVAALALAGAGAGVGTHMATQDRDPDGAAGRPPAAASAPAPGAAGPAGSVAAAPAGGITGATGPAPGSRSGAGAGTRSPAAPGPVRIGAPGGGFAVTGDPSGGFWALSPVAAGPPAGSAPGTPGTLPGAGVPVPAPGSRPGPWLPPGTPKATVPGLPKVTVPGTGGKQGTSGKGTDDARPGGVLPGIELPGEEDGGKGKGGKDKGDSGKGNSGPGGKDRDEDGSKGKGKGKDGAGEAPAGVPLPPVPSPTLPVDPTASPSPSPSASPSPTATPAPTASPAPSPAAGATPTPTLPSVPSATPTVPPVPQLTPVPDLP